MSKQYTLNKSERLKSRKSIEQLFNGGKTFNIAPIRVYYSFETSAPTLQFGAGASTRNFKHAVDRNRIKRLLRESWRLQRKPLTEILTLQNKGLNIFFIYTGKELPTVIEIREKSGKIIERLCKMVQH